LIALSLAFGLATASFAASLPNIVLIYADDIGYGDLGCYGATKVKTPNVDRLAREGLRFTDGHSASATCTPSRYALMTGEYPWRRKGTGVLPGDAGLIVEPGRTTLPSVLKEAGYATGCVGKWHLGLGSGGVDWNGDIKPGPREIGFDYSFVIPATGDRVPCVYVENHRVAGLDPADPIRVSYKGPLDDQPTGRSHPELLKMKLSQGHDCTIVNGISRIGYMSGGKAALWVDEDMADTLAKKAVAFIERSKDGPFFLYFATHDIHVPRVPHSRFKGTSGCGVRGDALQEFDGSVGEIVSAIERTGVAGNTLVIVSSDNGPVVDDGYADGAASELNGHEPAGPLRGGKYSAYEGGHRVPFIARWPGRIKAGTSDALVCQIDLIASLAALAGRPLSEGAAPDSVNVLPALLGESKEGRADLVCNGQVLGVRKGRWKYIEKGAGKKAEAELFDLAVDLGEKKDLAADQPGMVSEMAALLDSIRQKGRSP
jgi:arylsulfatase A-like enzyme